MLLQLKVLLFDEPLSNLDARMRTRMRTEITKLRQQLQTLIIYVTHKAVNLFVAGFPGQVRR
jgi:ABC-type sugar transport system ATPase subunit